MCVGGKAAGYRPNASLLKTLGAGFRTALTRWTFKHAAAVAFVGGYAAGSLRTGSGKGALQSGVSAVVFMGINAHYGKIASSSSGLSTAQVAQRALVSGVAGGVLSIVQGGRFGSGFASAGLGSALNPAISAVGDNTYAQTFMAAIVGGTVSEAAGGKFANGAITGAFQFSVGKLVLQAEMQEAQDLEDADNWKFVKNSKWSRRNKIEVSELNSGGASVRIGLTVARGRDMD